MVYCAIHKIYFFGRVLCEDLIITKREGEINHYVIFSWRPSGKKLVVAKLIVTDAVELNQIQL